MEEGGSARDVPEDGPDDDKLSSSVFRGEQCTARADGGQRGLCKASSPDERTRNRADGEADGGGAARNEVRRASLARIRSARRNR